MEVGSIVEAISNFDDVKRDWPWLIYPNRGDILTIKSIERHHKWGINKNTYKFHLLTFEEIDTYPLCDRNFRELLLPIDISEIAEYQHTEVRELQITN